ncbi:MAG: hypothetical protein M3094_05630, partial [Actinomycetia bacterium]|nr:hypothetical protein [Actinomycetes bacterium]
MTTLEQDAFDDRVHDNGLRIERTDDGGSDWLLSCAAPPIGLWKRDLGKRFTTLRAARAAVVQMEVVRLRRIKQARHLVLTAVFSMSAVWAYQIMALPDQWYRVEWFVAATFAVAAALSEGLSSFLMVIDDGWDYRYEVPRITLVDRVIAGVVLQYPTRRGHVEAIEAPKVRVVA